MYKDFETRTSYRYLKQVIDRLQEPICILGGWAVFFHVNKRFLEAQGRPYLGSRDIDLGFSMSSGSKKQILKQTMRILTEKLDFRPLSFRLVKEIHTETEEEIAEGKMIPAHLIFPMYIDLIVDTIPEGFKNEFGFNPIDEPLLREVFGKDGHSVMKEFGKKLLLPRPELLLAMKINSLPNRDKEHKRVKDICDIFALAWYAGLDLNRVNLLRYTKKVNLKRCLHELAEEDYAKAGDQLGHGPEEIKRVFGMLLSPQ